MARFVVVDLNVLRRWREARRLLRSDDQLVLPELMVGDILKSPDKETHKSCFESLVASEWRRIWFAHGAGVLEQLELQSGVAIAGMEWINHAMSIRLHEQKGDVNFNWDFVAGSDWFEAYHKYKLEFNEIRQKIADLVRGEAPAMSEWLASSAKHQSAEIAKPYLGANIPKAKNPLYQSDEWSKRLEVFPDRFAVGRMSRIYNWYGFLSPDRNDFDDANYAFVASYAGAMLTFDTALQRCVRMLFSETDALECGAPG